MEIFNTKVCVTGSSGYLGSWLVKKLLEKGYTVHATIRDFGDTSKIGHLKSLPNSETRLKFFEADMYNPIDYERPIQGCTFVFHLATLLPRDYNPQTQDLTEVAVNGIKSIVEFCKKSGSVKRLVYTASAVSASSHQDNGNSFKASMDESCWTPLNVPFSKYTSEGLIAYTHSKTLAEREVIRYVDECDDLEIVSLNCGLVGGDTILPFVPESLALLVSQIINNGRYSVLRFLEEMNGKIPIIHIEDVCDAHIFCAEKPSLSGRFLCASDYVSSAEIAGHWKEYYPDIRIPEEFVEDLGREIVWGSTKMEDIGFVYKYDTKMILDESLHCAKQRE